MRKLFTLLTLLVAIVTGAWGENISCSATVPAGQDGTFSNTETGITGTNCTLKYSGLQGGNNNIVTVNSVDYYKLGSNTAYVQLILSSGGYTSFQAGDVLTATVTSNGGTSAKTVDIKVGTSATSTVSVKGTETKNITYTLKSEDIEEDGSIKIYRNTNGSNLRVAVFSVTGTRVNETYTVTFDAGSNGTCTTESLTEESVGAGVTLPAVAPNDGYVFNGWYIAASEGTKVGDAGDTYKPTTNVKIFAQYSALSAPTINITNANVQTQKGTSVTFTAETTGDPIPTVTWYKNETSSTTGGTSVGTGSTYNPDVTTEGTYYYYAVASNSQGNATSEVITLTVTDPNKVVSGNSYYIEENETPVPDESIICNDITMTFVNGKAGESFTESVEDNHINDINSNYQYSISGSSGNNGWKAQFAPTVSGILKVGVIINNNKTFSITNVTSFSYKGINNKSPEPDDVSETISGNSFKTGETTADKLYVEVTINAVAGTEYAFSVAGSKMGFYGFEFTPAASVSVGAKGFATYCNADYALDFTGKSIEAYTVSSNDGTSLTLSKRDKVAKGEPVLLYSKTASDSQMIPAIAESAASADNTNKLVAGDGTAITWSESNPVYILYTSGATPGFYRANNSTVAAGKAYLDLNGTAGARAVSFNLNFDDVTAISEVATEVGDESACAPVYDLQGRRVAQPAKGLYIVNGKKVIIK